MSGSVMDYKATKNIEQKSLISCDFSQRNTKVDVVKKAHSGLMHSRKVLIFLGSSSELSSGYRIWCTSHIDTFLGTYLV